MNLQFEYDILTGNWNCIELTKATRNDQQDSKETIHNIQPKGLYIRDLGYVTTTYLKGICENNAFFINRLPKMGVYIQKENQHRPLDWNALDKAMKKNDESFTEMEVYIGKKEKIKCRMIIQKIPQEVASKRIRKASQGGKRTEGYQLSKEYKIKAHYNIFITNVPKEILNAHQILDAYRLRWQIEIIFKTWKSNLDIHNIKPVKTARMECQLLMRLIWILINSRLHSISQFIIFKDNPKTGCSIYKFLRFSKKFFRYMIECIYDLELFINWFKDTILPMLKDLRIEKRLKKRTHCEIINSVVNPSVIPF